MVEKVSSRPGSGQLLLIGLLVVVGGVALLLFGGSGEAPAFAGARDERAQASGHERSGTQPGASEANSLEVRTDSRSEVEGSGPTLRNEGADACFVVAGRCVDDAGRPLDAVAVSGVFDRVGGGGEHWLQDDDDDATSPETRTDDSGHFELRFRAAGRGEVSLDFEREGLLPVWLYSFRKDTLPGSRLELGDVRMTAGQRLTGRVVDTEGRPVVGAEVELWSESDEIPFEGWDGQVGDGRFETLTDGRGSFQMPDPVPPGEYYVHIPHRRVLRPLGDLVLAGGADPEPLQIVVSTQTGDAAREPISGRVVDSAGQPLSSVRISTGSNGRSHDNCYTRADGSFELRSRRDTRDAVGLFAARDGFVGWSADVPMPWGTRDVQIVLAPGARLTLVVTDARDGSPVERFGYELDGESRYSASRVSDRAGGREEFEPLTPGPLAVRVIAPLASGLIDPVGTRLDLQSDQELHVALLPRLEQLVEVVDQEGLAVADLVVQWVEYPDDATLEPLAAVSWVGDLSVAEIEEQPRLVASARTDRSGLARLSGVAGERSVAIRIPGPGCVPAVVMRPGLPDPEVPLQIVVARGASLVVDFGPEDVLAELRERAASDPDFDWEDVAFGVGLLRAEPLGDAEPRGVLPGDVGDLPFPFPSGRRVTLTGVPAGLWQVHIGWGNQDWSRSWPVGSPLRLDGAQTRRVRIGLDELRQQRLHVRALVNGQPVAAADVYCSRRTDGEVDEDDEDDSRSGETGADGTISFLVPPGTWVVSAWSNRADWDEVEVEVDRTSEARVELTCNRATRAIRVLRPDGSPLAWSDALDAEAEQGYPSIACTDDAGRSVLSGEPGVVTLRIPRAPFSVDGDAAWERFQERHPEVDDAARWIELGTFELRAGDDPSELLLRLPPEWAELPR